MTHSSSFYQLQLSKGESVNMPITKNQINTIQARAGEHYAVQQLNAAGQKLHDQVIAKRVGNDLQLTYADGTQVLIQDYYIECTDGACSLILPTENAEGVMVLSTETTGTALADGSTLVYLQGDQESLLAMSDGSEALQALIAEYFAAQQTLQTDWETGAGGEEASSVLPILLGAVGIAALAGGGGGGGSNAASPAEHSSGQQSTQESSVITLTVNSGETTGNDFNDNTALIDISGLQEGVPWEYSIDGGSNWFDGTGSSFTLPASSTHGLGDVVVRQTADGVSNFKPLEEGVVGGGRSLLENDTRSFDFSENIANAARYELSGIDKDHFMLDENTGELSFITQPDYEAPADVGSNNRYDIVVNILDNEGNLIHWRDSVITVIDVAGV